MSQIYFCKVKSTNKRKIEQIKEFLASLDLKYSKDIEYFIIALDGFKIVGSGGIAKNILKCIAIDESMRGEGFVLSLMSELLKLAFELNRHELFLFSKFENKECFESCGFTLIEQVKDEIVFMQNSNSLDLYKQSLKQYKKQAKKVACIVMNANPFTLGHLHLVKQASNMCDFVHVFVVKEDASLFSYEKRYDLICKNLVSFCNVFVHKGSEFVISKTTFPSYFLKDSKQVNSLYSKLDAQIFANHIAPVLGINIRFVGDEPFCEVTNEYNKQLKIACEKQGIELRVIKRKDIDGQIISASKVREFYLHKDFANLQKFVPKITFDFLKNEDLKEEKNA